MLGLLRKNVIDYSHRQLQKKFWHNFSSNPYHQWILQDRYIANALEEFFKMLPSSVLVFFQKRKPLLLLHSYGKYSCAVANIDAYVIIVFPELREMLHSFGQRASAFAVLAHELGHIIFEHGLKNIDPLVAQLQADHFAVQLGLRRELLRFLRQQPQSSEVKTRIDSLLKCSKTTYSAV
ncbi:MAG: hypothetical protein ACOCUH_03450 [Bacteriovoracia bacterium]